MKKIWINKARSFEEAEKFDINYYLAMSREERLSVMQYLRDVNSNIRGGKKDEGGKRLRRVIKIIQLQ